jgi:protein-disulfide isomerase
MIIDSPANRVALVTAVLLVLPGWRESQCQVSVDLGPSACKSLDAVAISKIQATAARIRPTSSGVPVIRRDELVPGTCYRRVALSSEGDAKEMTLFMSPDQRYVFPMMWDVDASIGHKIAIDESAVLNEAKADHVPTVGSSDSNGKEMVVFSDFECPYCRDFHRMLVKYEEEHPGKLKVFYRQYPLSIHPWAEQAALAQYCVLEQGEGLFWSGGQFLFQEQETLSADSVIQRLEEHLVKQGGLDEPRFSACMQSPRPRAALERDKQIGQRAGVHATPTVITKTTRHGGFRSESELKAFLQED